MEWIDAVVHWSHLMAAILWVGGTLTASVVLQPALKAALDDPRRMAVYAELGRRLSVLQWATWSVLLVSGSLKLWSLRAATGVFAGPFGRVLAAKLCLVAAMVVLSLLHARSWGPRLASGALAPDERAALARRAAFWGKVNGALMAAIVFCAALLRYNPF